MGYPREYGSPAEVWEEIAALTPPFQGIDHARLREEPVVWPCVERSAQGEAVLFTRTFPRGRGLFVPAEFAPPQELPDEEFPYVLNTGRMLQHWHTGSMTRRALALDEIAPEPFVEVHPDDAERLGLADAAPARVRSRRGEVIVPVRVTTRVDRGCVFIPFHFREAAANLLTNDALDPTAKIPEFKYCAVQVEAL
jgi:predicted molibdopterin-dependent oxidoreductase YjgC